MSTLNKVLAILNVVAAIICLTIAVPDYARRQAWTFAVLREDFILKGLPVDDNEKDAEGRPLVKLVGKSMQEQLFTGLSEPVTTQKKEAAERQKALLAKIGEAADAADKKKIIENVLVPLAQSWGQRDELRRKIRDPNVSVETLLAADGPFEAAFKEALEGKPRVSEEALERRKEALERKPRVSKEALEGKTDELAFEERRQAIAHLLCNLSDNPDDHRRALAVVGIRAYVHEVDSQAMALGNMVPEIQHALEADLGAFEVEHKDLIRQIVLLADRVRHLDEILQTQTLLAQEHTTLLAARQADVQRVSAEIDEAKKATAIALKGQSELEDALFKAHRTIATAAEKNQQLLRQIDRHELGR